MAEKQTLARPYAVAVFDLAKGRGALKPWSEMLALLAAVASDESMARLSQDPQVDHGRFIDLFVNICGKNLTADGANFLRLLVENRRLMLLPEIRAQYETLKADAEARVEVAVVSAFPLEAAQIKALSEALKRKLGREVNLTTTVDKALMGGVVIRAGDLVIDGSVRGRLADLAAHMNT
jgi:F-type H+-transporting ATPase subunit delta